ncbi:uncharacterized protein LOC133726162 isoform X4 [Rosa rugosa]|uniref:uncharacterized protein LOC133726162 isoform X4 n=1 Tax=Rosa rugosa TaxID=74645 RepID=UPI002B4015BF|nr:uncharacterized protein LOC133726162 isoform X4 [Rosa rugosa]
MKIRCQRFKSTTFLTLPLLKIESMAATVAVPSAIVHKVLTTNNYEDWSIRVKTYLLAKGLWKVVGSAMEPPRVEDEAEFEAWSKNNAEALHAIHISCGDDTFSFIRDMDTAKAAWNTLEKKLKPARLPKRKGHSSNANSATNDHDDKAYKHFFDCVKNGWCERSTADAREFLKKYPHPIRELRHPSSGLPALHFAI